MRFLWPGALAALALIPLLILLFAWQQRRRRRFAVRFSSLSLVRAALPTQSRLRRYLPMGLFLAALASLALSLARPVATTLVPAGRATVMLAMDVSGSMRQSDVSPSRFVAAKQAALEFVSRQKDANQVGLVAFAGWSQLVQAPTTDGTALREAISRLTMGRGTAIGDGILSSLDAIADFEQSAGGRRSATPESGGAARAPGSYKPDIIVLLTDGAANRGVDPLEAAQQAAGVGIRVYTIGFGTQEGSFDEQGGFGMRWGIDEETLKAIASITGGEYYSAASAGELQKVFDNLPTVLVTREETVEISVVFAALAALVVVAAVLLSQLWHPLP